MSLVLQHLPHQVASPLQVLVLVLAQLQVLILTTCLQQALVANLLMAQVVVQYLGQVVVQSLARVAAQALAQPVVHVQVKAQISLHHQLEAISQAQPLVYQPQTN